MNGAWRAEREAGRGREKGDSFPSHFPSSFLRSSYERKRREGLASLPSPPISPCMASRLSEERRIAVRSCPSQRRRRWHDGTAPADRRQSQAAPAHFLCVAFLPPFLPSSFPRGECPLPTAPQDRVRGRCSEEKRRRGRRHVCFVCVCTHGGEMCEGGS